MEVAFDENRDSGAHSGRNSRPGLSRLLLASSKLNCSLCVIESLEHLSPLQTEQEVILHYLKAEGVSVVSIKEPTLCRGDRDRSLLRQCLDYSENFRKISVVGRMAAAKRQARKRAGHHDGPLPYGGLPGEAEVIERIKFLRLQRMGFDRIAACLNLEGIKPRRGKAWYGATINGIVGPRYRRRQAR